MSPTGVVVIVAHRVPDRDPGPNPINPIATAAPVLTPSFSFVVSVVEVVGAAVVVLVAVVVPEGPVTVVVVVVPEVAA